MIVRLIDMPLAIPRYRQVRLPTVAAEIGRYAEVEINDENIEPVNFSAADLIGISAQAYNFPRALYLADRFRELGIPTILGGPASVMTDRALEHFDAVVVGEVEGLGEKIIADAEQGRLKGVYRLAQPPKNWGEHLPRRDLQKAGKYYWVNFPIEFSRGCPHRCSFCFGRHFLPGFRTRSLESIERELDHWDHGLVEAVDLHFAADRDYIIEVCRLLENKGVWGWMGEATLASLDDDKLLKHLERSQCKVVFVGMESVEKNVLAQAQKGFNPVEEYARIIRKVQSHGIFVHTGLMWGLTGQSVQSFDDTYRFCEEAGVFLASTNIATWFPGTPDYETLKDQDKLITRDIRKYDGAHVMADVGGLSEDLIYQGARRFLDRFYSFRSILARSFNAANFRFAQNADFWAMNLTYRAYYRMWVRRLGKTRSPWPVSRKEKQTFPLMGGKMPFIYPAGNLLWIFFHYWYLLWQKVSGPLSVFSAVIPIIIWLIAGIWGYRWISDAAAGHWPIKYPPVAPVLVVFVLFYWIGTWLTGRLARVAYEKWSPAGSRLFLLLPSLITIPLVLTAMILHPADSEWSFLLMLFSIIFLFKSYDVLLVDPIQRRMTARVISFILFFPTLDYKNSFSPDTTKVHFSRHWLSGYAGFFRLLAGLVLGFFLAGWIVTASGTTALHVLLIFGRLLCLYLVLRGALDWSNALWRQAGYKLPDAFGYRPFGPLPPSGLWRAWDIPLGDFLLRHVYIPLDGRNRPVIAVMAIFAMIGGMTAAMTGVATGRWSWGVFVFFPVNGLMVVAEKLCFPAGVPQKWIYPFFLTTVALFLLTAPWMFDTTDKIFW